MEEKVTNGSRDARRNKLLMEAETHGGVSYYWKQRRMEE